MRTGAGRTETGRVTAGRAERGAGRPAGALVTAAGRSVACGACRASWRDGGAASADKGAPDVIATAGMAMAAGFRPARRMLRRAAATGSMLAMSNATERSRMCRAIWVCTSGSSAEKMAAARAGFIA